MARLSISLPDSTLITLESGESGVLHEVLRTVLQIVQPVPQMSLPTADAPFLDPWPEAVPSGATQVSVGLHSPAPQGEAANFVESGGAPSNGTLRPANGQLAPQDSHAVPGDDRLELGRYPLQARQDFVAFCLAINPTGDMRRVVVAAEAANRFFSLDGVHADEVGELFDLIGWRRANSFTQTIRNAARAKFGWMERIPGRSGRYAATEIGRSTTLSG